MKPIIVTRGPLPLTGYAGITLYPFIFLRKPVTERVLRHELIHFQQVRRKGMFRWYGTYLWKAVCLGYRGIPAEVEVYHNQSDPNWLDFDLEAIVAGYWK